MKGIASVIDRNLLFETQFSHSLTEDSVQNAKRLLKLPKKKRSQQSERSIYIHQVLDSFSELERIVENLDMAEVFLKSYPVSKLWKDKYDQNHYFTYHYEMWIVNAIRLYERLLILINSVYWLEIDHRVISYIEVSQHPKLQGTSVLKILNTLHGALSNLQGVKNSVFHRYLYTDEELSEIATYNFLARNSKGKERERFSRIAQLKMRYLYLPKKRKEVSNNNKELLQAVNTLLETFEGQYCQHRDSLSDHDDKPHRTR